MNEKEFLQRLGKKIRKLRNERVWTLVDLEAQTNIDAGDLSKLELGYTNSKILTLYKISQAFGITIDKLLDIEKNA